MSSTPFKHKLTVSKQTETVLQTTWQDVSAIVGTFQVRLQNKHEINIRLDKNNTFQTSICSSNVSISQKSNYNPMQNFYNFLLVHKEFRSGIHLFYVSKSLVEEWLINPLYLLVKYYAVVSIVHTSASTTFLSYLLSQIIRNYYYLV